MKLIDKTAVVAEIKRKIEAHKETLKNCDSSISEMELRGSMSAYQSLLHFLDTIEVKKVNIEKELDEWIRYGPHTNYPWCTIPDAIKITAEHFFNLGLKAQKGE